MGKNNPTAVCDGQLEAREGGVSLRPILTSQHLTMEQFGVFHGSPSLLRSVSYFARKRFRMSGEMVIIGE